MTQTKKLNLAFLVLVVVYIAGSLLYAVFTADIGLSVYVDLAVSELFVLIPVCVYMKLGGIYYHRDIGHRPLRPWAVVCLVGITILAMPLVMFLNVLSSMIAGNAMAELSVELAYGSPWLNFLFLAVVPAAVEEFVFRGVFFHGYRRHGLWKAALISGLIFGLMHLNLNQFSYGFTIGVLFALLAEATGSIYAPMLVHFLINMQSVSAINSLIGLDEGTVQMLSSAPVLSPGLQQTYYLTAAGVLGIIAVVTTALLVLLIKLLAKLSDREDYFRWVLQGGEREALRRNRSEKLFDPFFFAGAAVCVGFMIYQLFQSGIFGR